jgi:hypothetical protein
MNSSCSSAAKLHALQLAVARLTDFEVRSQHFHSRTGVDIEPICVCSFDSVNSKHMDTAEHWIFHCEGDALRAKIRSLHLRRTAAYLGADIMARDDLREHLLPLCAGLVHPQIWDFCKNTSGGGMRWADTRQRVYYLMVRFVQLMHIMWGLRCRHVHSRDPTSPAGQHRDRFLRATNLSKLELNNPDSFEAFLNGRWWPVTLTQSLPQGFRRQGIFISPWRDFSL